MIAPLVVVLRARGDAMTQGNIESGERVTVVMRKEGSAGVRLFGWSDAFKAVEFEE